MSARAEAGLAKKRERITRAGSAMCRVSALHRDFDRDAVGDDVVHGRAGARLFDDLAQLLGGSVAFDLERDAHVLIAVTHGLREAENAEQVDIALDGGFDSVRNGYRQIRVSFVIEGDATPEQLAAVVEQSRKRSAVYDVLTNGTDVVVDVTTPSAA